METETIFHGKRGNRKMEKKLTRELIDDLMEVYPDEGLIVWKYRDLKYFKGKISREGAQQKWNKRFAGKQAFNNKVSMNGKTYLKGTIFGKSFSASYVIWTYVNGNPKGIVRHIDGDTFNNSISNLEDVGVRQRVFKTQEEKEKTRQEAKRRRSEKQLRDRAEMRRERFVNSDKYAKVLADRKDPDFLKYKGLGFNSDLVIGDKNITGNAKYRGKFSKHNKYYRGDIVSHQGRYFRYVHNYKVEDRLYFTGLEWDYNIEHVFWQELSAKPEIYRRYRTPKAFS